MRYRADISVFGRDGLLKLLVEVKNKRGASRQWAAKLRRNMYAHGQLPKAPFFLLALPDKFYLWKGEDIGVQEVEPDVEADPRPLLQPYLERVSTLEYTLDESSFELVITFWLDHLISMNEQAMPLHQHDEWLRASGLMDAIRGGRVEVQAVV